MSSITIDVATVEKLRSLGSPAELHDPQGNIVGFFRPSPFVGSEAEIPELSEDELKRCFSEAGKLTTSELIRRLRESK